MNNISDNNESIKEEENLQKEVQTLMIAFKFNVTTDINDSIQVESNNITHARTYISLVRCVTTQAYSA